jgi:hypothetical protein
VGVVFLHHVHGSPDALTSKRFIELFAGSCRVSLAVARLGIQSESFEILRSLIEDVTSVENTSSLLNRIQRRRVGCLWAGIACASWSRARRGKGYGHGFPPPLRDDHEFIWGLMNLSCKDQDRVKLGNKLLRWLCRIIKACILHNVPIVVENPGTSRLWICPPMARLVAQATSDIVFDACQFGTDWRKPTRLVCWGGDLTGLDRRCHASGHPALCSRTHKEHIKLVGTHPDGSFWTAKASPYPLEFCKAFARIASCWCAS